MTRHALLFAFSVLALSACSSSTPASGDGVCCPIDNFRPPCDPGVQIGGWAPSIGECSAHVSTSFDGSWDISDDARGCATWTSGTDYCCGCPPADASFPDGGI
ncbi:MAG: hypothetical protein KC619_20545 [Myxococcales bacterium]|nr:hypothetical protein [Myxococcales bacterium]